MIYNIKNNTCGVYLIRNKLTGKSYVGSSTNVSHRFSNHLNRDARRYYWREFYQDVLTFGKINFECILLEECDKEKLLEREQYYYDLIKPEYNVVRPNECNFKNKTIKILSKNSDRYKKAIEKRKIDYNNEYYKKLFSNIQNKRKKPVNMYLDGILIKEFESLSACANYITIHTNFKGKNKVSKIKAVCDEQRPTAYGYEFKYKCNDYSERK